jgi:hypothetical protein
MHNIFSKLLLGLSLLSCSRAEIDVPRCQANEIDPGTGISCGQKADGRVIPVYGYDDTVSSH